MKSLNKSILVLFAFLMIASCEDKLNLEPISAIGENGFFTSQDEVEAAVIGIYDGLQAVPLREFALTEMRSDNTVTRTSEGDWAQFESYNVKSTNMAISDYWSSNYNVIFRANKVLENLDVVASESKKAQFEGEAKFVRALCYFNLVRAYGGVPIVDKVIIQSDTDYFMRSTVDEVFTFIINDLTDATADLPTRSQILEGRATSGAANALLAKVYLTQGNYTQAEPLLEALIASSDYALVDEYSDVFYAELNSEIIFAIQYLDDAGDNDDGGESQDFSFEMTPGGRASGLNHITDDFIASLDPLDTERTSVLLRSGGNSEVGKFVTTSSNARQCGNDWIVLRLADVYLMHAEAIMAGSASTNSISAITSYNAVRDRAGLSTLAVDGSATLTQQMLLDERRVELAFENHRLYDLIRFGVAESVLGDFAAANGYNFTGTDLLLPIPQREYDTSDGILKQNPGYN